MPMDLALALALLSCLVVLFHGLCCLVKCRDSVIISQLNMTCYASVCLCWVREAELTKATRSKTKIKEVKVAAVQMGAALPVESSTP